MAANCPGLTCRPRLERTFACACNSFQTCFLSGMSRRIVGAESAGRPPRLTRRPFNSFSNAITTKGPSKSDFLNVSTESERRRHGLASQGVDVEAAEPHDASPKVGRDEPFPCGSGKKFKNVAAVEMH